MLATVTVLCIQYYFDALHVTFDVRRTRVLPSGFTVLLCALQMS